MHEDSDRAGMQTQHVLIQPASPCTHLCRLPTTRQFQYPPHLPLPSINSSSTSIPTIRPCPSSSHPLIICVHLPGLLAIFNLLKHVPALWPSVAPHCLWIELIVLGSTFKDLSHPAPSYLASHSTPVDSLASSAEYPLHTWAPPCLCSPWSLCPLCPHLHAFKSAPSSRKPSLGPKQEGAPPSSELKAKWWAPQSHFEVWRPGHGHSSL